MTYYVNYDCDKVEIDFIDYNYDFLISYVNFNIKL